MTSDLGSALRASVAGDRRTLTFLHHADVDAALQTTGLAVTPVVFGDGAVSVERAGKARLTLHTAPERQRETKSQSIKENILQVTW